MMKRVVFAAVLAVCFMTQASALVCPSPAEPTCDPVTQTNRTLCSNEVKLTLQLPSGQTGSFRGWWYWKESSVGVWSYCAFRWGVLEKYAPKTAAEYLAIVNLIEAQPSITAGIADAIAKKGIKPPVGSVDEHDFQVLMWEGCKAMQAAPPQGGWSPDGVPHCKEPAPLPPPPAGWTAYGGTIFKVINGKLASVVAGKTATKGAACIGTTIATAGTFVYQQLTGGPTDEATRCVKP